MGTSDSSEFETKLSLARRAKVQSRHELLEDYRDYLLLLASIGADRNLRSKLGDSDLVQETMIQAHRDLEQFRGTTETELVGWLRAIMSKKKALLARKFYATAARDPRREEQLNQEAMKQSSELLNRAFVARDASPSQHAVGRERGVLLANALAALPEHYRRVVILHHIQGRSLPEIAEEMGRTVDSVKKLWARAMIQLRSLLGRIE